MLEHVHHAPSLPLPSVSKPDAGAVVRKAVQGRAVIYNELLADQIREYKRFEAEARNASVASSAGINP